MADDKRIEPILGEKICVFRRSKAAAGVPGGWVPAAGRSAIGAAAGGAIAREPERRLGASTIARAAAGRAAGAWRLGFRLSQNQRAV